MNISSLRFTHTPGYVGLISILGLGLLIAGCGKKTFPTQISEELPPKIHDLQTVVRSKGVELTWTVPAKARAAGKESAFRFSVLKSELKWENRNCLDCPAPIQQEAQIIDPAFPAPALMRDDKLSWTDSSVSAQRAYRYQVVLQDRRGRPIVYSNPVNAKIVAPPPPPGNAVAAPTNQGIMIQWRPPSRGADGQPLQGDLQFVIERFLPNKSWEKVSPVPVKGNTYLDQTVAAERAYSYRITSLLYFEDTGVMGEPSATVQAKAPEALPPPPPHSVWVIPSKGGLEIQWTESDAKVSGYHVYRREGKEIIRLTGSPIPKPPYIDRSAKPNNVYYYAVSSVGLQPDTKEGLVSKWAEIRALKFE